MKKYDEKKYIALFIGRFQPFHLGHYKALKEILQKYKKVVIAIGSANITKRDKKNLFLVNERIEMIKKCIRKRLKKYEKNIFFSKIADKKSDLDWIESLKKRFSPKKYIICSRNPLVLKLAKIKNYKIFKPRFYNRKILQGKKIRKLIFERKIYRLKKFVLKEIYDYIKRKINVIKFD
ncbi:MAG: adenylyltransferase/cytidyltransferase family protein [Candidatus Micrarchaeota archaeon]|nr:adenylyltransferase/cytidyltransferase family protein [Candidatus Micrarchaeota archaeon]